MRDQERAGSSTGEVSPFGWPQKANPCPRRCKDPDWMQQLRERAGKIVQHLTVEEVSGADGIQRIKQEMERSPIIKLLDQKKVDQRRQKFMKLTRLH